MNLTARIRYASALVGIALAVWVPGIASAANFAGSWSFSGAMGNPLVETVAPVCVFRQSGNNVAGSCKGPAGIGSASGVVSGSRIIFRWNRIATSSAQQDGIITFNGVWGSSGLRGTWTDTYRPGYVGAFSAFKV